SHLWSKRFGGSPINNDAGYTNAVTIDRSDNIVITGTLNDAVDFGGGPLPGDTPGDVFLAKFNSSGTHLWSKPYEGGQYYSAGNGVAADASGNIFATGEFFDRINFGPTSSTEHVNVGGLNMEDGFLVKLSP